MKFNGITLILFIRIVSCFVSNRKDGVLISETSLDQNTLIHSNLVLLADRTNGRAYATVLRLSVVCRL